MGVSKIIFGDTVLVDLTGDTVTAATLDKGATAHDKAGNQIVGTMEAGESSRFGATLDTFMGDVDSNGVLQAPSAETNLVFSGVTDIGDSALKYFRYHSTIDTDNRPICSDVCILFIVSPFCIIPSVGKSVWKLVFEKCIFRMQFPSINRVSIVGQHFRQ